MSRHPRPASLAGVFLRTTCAARTTVGRPGRRVFVSTGMDGGVSTDDGTTTTSTTPARLSGIQRRHHDDQTTHFATAAEMCSPHFLRCYRPHQARREMAFPASPPRRQPSHVRPAPVRARCACPVYGVRASAGRRARMEDAVSIVENLLEVSRPSSFWKTERKKGDLAAAVESNGSEAPSMCETEVCHFFGVYDGHNGPYAAHHCRGRLHENLRAVYLDLCSGGDSDTDSVTVMVDSGAAVTTGEGQEWSSSESSNTCLSDRSANERTPRSRPRMMSEEDVFLETFRRTDSQFSEYRCAERVGTTALTALVGSKHITVGSCGTTRSHVCWTSHGLLQVTHELSCTVPAMRSNFRTITDWTKKKKRSPVQVSTLLVM